MKSYTFAKVSARGRLTDADYNNKYIITEDLKQIINVSERGLGRPFTFFKQRNIIAKHLPLTEDAVDMGYLSLTLAVRFLMQCDKEGKRSIVCCDFGNNRSRTVVEAFHYAKMGFHFEDEYKGYQNHLIYNCSCGFLPPLSDVEDELRRIGNEYNTTIRVSLEDMKKCASTATYNTLAAKMNRFINEIQGLDTYNNQYENLSSIISNFTQVKIKDGYVLDGFHSGSRHSSRVVLHARKEEGKEFTPLYAHGFRDNVTMFDALKDETDGVLREWIEENLEVFDDSMYIRTLVHYTLAEHLVKPIWEDVSVPFNEEGIWEAVLLYAAPNIMPGGWHAYYTHIDPVCNESDHISRCETLEDYVKHYESDILHPKVYIDSEDKARVFFTAWGYNGLKLHEFVVRRCGESVSIKEILPYSKYLLYYEPEIIV